MSRRAWGIALLVTAGIVVLIALATYTRPLLERTLEDRREQNGD